MGRAMATTRDLPITVRDRTPITVARITSATAIGGITGNDANTINVKHRGLIDFNAFESSTFKHRDISQIILDRKLRGSNRRRLAPRAISKSEGIVFSKLYEIGTRPCFIAPLRLGDRSTAICACRAASLKGKGPKTRVVGMSRPPLSIPIKS